ncbi:DsbA family protein [Chelatococcus sambhunathii]|uniref:DsbA family protein n=1 Tax=Chelatococcus sambhunathii TaxID=363953 RepID=A0ABU1DHX9_9HYPH|nr:DsbA family protein [Chelatococcus sambhunathii]MDR4307630.1 DsbA family protein [Chelatococcus sambhunathii]
MTVRRIALALAALFLAAAPALAQSDVSREMIVGDPAAPVGGDPEGDVTIVAYLDYNCPYCKRSAPALDRLVKSDGKVRLVYKEWPILSESSVVGAKLALAAKYQGKYEAAHKALMGLVGAKVPADKMTAALTSAGIDMARLKADAAAHNAEISAALKRNDAQARGMQFRGTPVYLIGPLLVAAPLDYEGFKDAVAQARERQKK